MSIKSLFNKIAEISRARKGQKLLDRIDDFGYSRKPEKNLRRIQRLIERSAPLSARERYNGYTPLILAAKRGREEVVDMLIAAGAGLNDPDKDDNTPLTIALGERHSAITGKLVAAGADVNAPGQFGMTPIMFAATHDDAGDMQLLIAAGASVDAQDNHDRTALILSIQRGSLKSIETLLSAKAVLEKKDNTGRTALDTAAANANVDVVRTLIAAGARPNTSAFAAVIHESTMAAGEFLDKKLKTISVLHELGVPLNNPDVEGNTPLHLAAKLGRAEIVLELLEHGADCFIKDSEGKTALALAQEKGHKLILRLLREYETLQSDHAIWVRNGMPLKEDLTIQKPVTIVRRKSPAPLPQP